MAPRKARYKTSFATRAVRWQTFKRLARQGERWLGVEGGGLPNPLLVRLGKTPEGTLVCTGIIIGADEETEIGSRALRDVKPTAIVNEIAERLKQARQGKALPKGTPPSIAAFYRALYEVYVEEAAAPVERTPRHPGRGGYSDQHFEDVAAAYREALTTDPRRPLQGLKRAFPHTSEATLRRWVRQARDRRFLGESLPGKAGERKRRGGRKR